MAKKKEPKYCVAILASNAKPYNIREKENAQLQCIKEYARANNIILTHIYRRGETDSKIIRRFFLSIVEEIHKKHIHGVVAVNMACISESMADAYSKIGKIKEAGGIIYTVEEGNLGMNIHMNQIAKEEDS